MKTTEIKKRGGGEVDRDWSTEKKIKEKNVKKKKKAISVLTGFLKLFMPPPSVLFLFVAGSLSVIKLC